MRGMIRRSLFGLAACLLTVNLQAADIETRIIGGDLAPEGSWPATVAVNSQLNDLTYQFCGGTLIDPRWVVTAAHCLYNGNLRIPADKITVRAGSTDLESAEMQTILVTNAFHPQEYKPSAGLPDYDIALLELATAAQEPAVPIKLNPEIPAVGTIATVTGWGVTEDSQVIVDNLREVQLPIVSNETCNEPESYGGLITDNMLCAGYPQGGADACFGDSGGPLMVYSDGLWKLTGVVSFGQDCALPDKYGVYMRITAFLDWITSYVDTGVDIPEDNGDTSSDSSGGGGFVSPLFMILLTPFVFSVFFRHKTLG